MYVVYEQTLKNKQKTTDNFFGTRIWIILLHQKAILKKKKEKKKYVCTV